MTEIARTPHIRSPFGALDISTRLKMQDFFANIWRKALQDMTIIFVTHDIPEAVYLADEVWIMSANPGQIVERVHIDIPIYRANDMKRTKQFTDYVYYLDDKPNRLVCSEEFRNAGNYFKSPNIAST